MILAISEPDDPHAGAVLEVLAGWGEPARRLDLAALPRQAALSVRHGVAGGDAGATFLGLPDGPLRAADATAVWWRRPRPAVPHAELAPDDAAFAVSQVHAALSGVWGSLNVGWMNDPWLDDRACQKVAQLAAAEAAGLAVPPTLVTSAPADARAFLDGLDGRPAVHKPLEAGRVRGWRPTRLVGPRERARLDDLRFGPAILQAYVPGVDVRVTAAGGRLLATSIDARATASPHDFRPAFEQAQVAPWDLPEAAAAGVHRYLAAFGLRYAALDFRLDADGRLWFLEANPSGQWLFLEDRTGQPITAAVAAALVEASRENSSREVTADGPVRPPAWRGSPGRRSA